MLGWLAVERLEDGAAISLGAAQGIIADLAAITPGAGFVGGLSPLVFGLASGAICYLAISLKTTFGYDDSLDVVGVHMVSGIVGGALLGLLADVDVFSPGTMEFQGGALTSGGWGGGTLIWDQLEAMGAVLVFSFVATTIVAKVLDAAIGPRVDEVTEERGLDLGLHAESAYI